MTSHNSCTSGGMRSGAIAFILLGSLVLAGCSGGAPADPGPSSSASEPSSPSATPTPTPTPSAVYKPADASGPAQNVPVPVLPEVAKTETKEGLEAFAKYWFEQLNYAYQTGDIAGFDAVTSPNCVYCSKLTASLTTNYQGDRWLAGGKITTPASTTSFERSSDGNFQVILQVLQSPVIYYETGGKEFRTASDGSNTGNVLLANFVNGAWRVNDLHPIR
ncbi:hypothetical protein QF038_003252 [Pseudarthrobacter sp. W1I19]|uniref:DUF6318 family protein n=1 Tax=Pseudarthrobacter sp. W1I19 TaxID=3042288 RepID=UPI0027831A37|nr:DUF6318 family protein [Pseudarthrobacter sp. W1I19]MDQ0924744.1 hypothetical protein [Pseudarthrobacter sp. W1I19]